MYSCTLTSNDNCPFCRVRDASSDDEKMKSLNAHVAANDAEAIFQLGCRYDIGAMGVPRDLNKAMELVFQAAELGSNTAHNDLGNLYCKGHGGNRDRKKAKYHLEIAAMAGNEYARHALGRNRSLFFAGSWLVVSFIDVAAITQFWRNHILSLFEDLAPCSVSHFFLCGPNLIS